MRNFSILSKDFHSFSSLNYRLELGVVRSKAVRRETKGGRVAFFLFFSFLLLFECLETNKNFGGNRGSGSAISGGNLGFTIGHVGKPRLLRFVAGVTGWKNRLAARSFAWPRSFPRTRLTGGGERSWSGGWPRSGKIKFSFFPSRWTIRKKNVESFPKSGISTLHLLSLSPFPFFLSSPQKEKSRWNVSKNASWRLLHRNCAPLAEIVDPLNPTDRPSEITPFLPPNFLYQFLYTRAPLSLFVNFIAARFAANFQWHFNLRQTHSQFSPFPTANVYSSFNGQTVKSRPLLDLRRDWGMDFY